MPETDADALLSFALTTPEAVVGYLFETSMDVDKMRPALNRIINWFSATIQGPLWLNRELEIRERVEYFDIWDPSLSPWARNRNRVQVAAPPFRTPDFVDPPQDPPPAMVEVWNSPNRVYDDATKLVPYSTYAVEEETGSIFPIAGWFAGGPKALKVRYTGGLVLPAIGTGDYPVVPIELQLAATQQVAAWWQRRKELNLDSVAFPGGGAIALMDPTRLVESVQLACQNLRRYRGAA